MLLRVNNLRVGLDNNRPLAEVATSKLHLGRAILKT